MTTRTKRSAKSSRIEALVGDDRELLKGLLKESLQEVLEAEMTEAVGGGPRGANDGPGRVPIRVLQPRLGDADREVGAPGAAGSGGAVLDRAL